MAEDVVKTDDVDTRHIGESHNSRTVGGNVNIGVAFSQFFVR